MSFLLIINKNIIVLSLASLIVSRIELIPTGGTQHGARVSGGSGQLQSDSMIPFILSIGFPCSSGPG